MHPQIQQLLTIVDQAYDRKSWHGTNLRGSIRGLTAEQVVWRPSAGRHSIQELVVHAAYWKYAVLRRLTGGARGSFPLKGSNFFKRHLADDGAWREDVALLARMHRDLREAIAQTLPAHLHDALPNSELTPLTLITGIAAHDLYHAGQIQLLKAMRQDARRSASPSAGRRGG
jgi:uncharacterized damage-inducible protein DinB